jgi:hypothetical protein
VGPEVPSVAARLHAIADNPEPAALASLHLIAAAVGRMERALNELVSNALADARGVDAARGWTDLGYQPQVSHPQTDHVQQVVPPETPWPIRTVLTGGEACRAHGQRLTSFRVLAHFDRRVIGRG